MADCGLNSSEFLRLPHLLKKRGPSYLSHRQSGWRIWAHHIFSKPSSTRIPTPAPSSESPSFKEMAASSKTRENPVRLLWKTSSPFQLVSRIILENPNRSGKADFRGASARKLTFVTEPGRQFKHVKLAMRLFLESEAPKWT